MSVHPSVCPEGWGHPYPIMLCNITQNAMGQTPGGYPYPIMLCNITQNSMGQTPRGVPCQVQPGGYPAGGVPCQGDTLLEGYPAGGTHIGYLPGQVRMGGYAGRVPPGRVPPPRARSGQGVVPS